MASGNASGTTTTMAIRYNKMKSLIEKRFLAELENQKRYYDRVVREIVDQMDRTGRRKAFEEVKLLPESKDAIERALRSAIKG